ncbi:tRNA isopentenyltransferase [Pluteus cervinus]|uniref:tRNA isopentenyltransferase n=1 Tax=Pluteus cervinus TaxID=181527 RepID=A0ACD3B3G9_9AGAR|nr:tRNA isopentenyltransferase [Pluteus cervinus]
MSANPIVAILGTTGVGKSNLAVELALHLTKSARASGWHGARVINADSMQVYSGMDIITNKIPMTERQGIEHLLMGFKKPGEQYTVGQWVDETLKLIEDTHKQRKIPIIVGGTSYWIQHLIFPNRLASRMHAQPRELSTQLQANIASLPQDLLEVYNNLPERPPSASTEPEAASRLHALLHHLDAEVAQRWHWKDTRKVSRSLEIMKETGRLPSEIIVHQSQSQDAGAPRFESLCFWLYADLSVLEQRLNERVDSMVQRGLLQEIQALQDLSKISETSSSDGLAESQRQVDYTLGIYQAIGYREFSRYLSISAPTSRDYGEAVERMKISTRQYAKRQISWMRNKFLPAVYGSKTASTRWLTPLYLLDATNLDDRWKSGVLIPAITVTEDFLAGNELVDPTSMSETAKQVLANPNIDTSPSVVLTCRKKIVCDMCTLKEGQPFMVEEGREWEAHTRSRAHRRRAKEAYSHTAPSQ